METSSPIPIKDRSSIYSNGSSSRLGISDSNASNGWNVGSSSLGSDSLRQSQASTISRSPIRSPIPIPNRSSSVAAQAPIPTRISSMASPTRADLSTSASDLADTIANLKLADDPDASTGTVAAFQQLAPTLNPAMLSAEDQGPSSLSFLSPARRREANSSGSERLFMEVSDQISEVDQSLEGIRRHIFFIQEKRHAGTFSSAQVASSSTTSELSPPPSSKNGAGDEAHASELDLALMQLDEKLEGVSRSMQQLEVRMSEVAGLAEEDDDDDDDDGEQGDSSMVDREIKSWKSRPRRNSLSSMSSFTSFDEAMLPAFAPALGPQALRRKYDEVVADWAKVQEESNTLRKELGDDKYLIVFRSVSDQADSMMDSLDRAMAHCQDFVTRFNRDHQSGAISRDRQDGGDEAFDSSQQGPTARLEELAALKKTFGVKKSYYAPACDQVFNVLERGTKDRATSNGTILRRFSELKARWKQSRERVSKMEKELTRIEVILKKAREGEEVASGASVLSSSHRPIAFPRSMSSKQLQQAALGQGSPNRPSAILPKSNLRSSVSSGRIVSGPSRLSSSSSFGSSHVSGTTPPQKPPKSGLRRMSATAESLQGFKASPPVAPTRTSSKLQGTPQRPLRAQRSQVITGTATDDGARHLRSSSAAVPQYGEASSETRPQWNSSTRIIPNEAEQESPAKLAALRASGRTTPLGHYSTPPRTNRELPSYAPSSYRGPGFDATAKGRSKTPQPQPSWTRSSSNEPVNVPPMPARPSSRTSSRIVSNRSLFGGHSEAGDSSMEWVKASESSGNDDGVLGTPPKRPGSAFGMYYRPPSAMGSASGDERARKRESMIPRLVSRDATPSGTPQRPGSSLSQASTSHFTHSGSTPPRYTGASRLTMQTPEPTIAARAQRLSMYARSNPNPSGTPGGAAKRSSRPPPTRLNHGGTNYMSPMRGGGASGRTTPLSAAALAAVPHAEPGSQISSVANYRSHKVSGRTTPTFSDAGASSVGGFSSAGNWGATGHRSGAIESYRPNPNDTLDVHVASIANALGVSVERIDPPLPKGVKLDEGPGKDNRTRYLIGGKDVVCRLLELHRPAGSAGALSGTKAKKILVRVGGGWQDLEQWLLNVLGAQ
ncbi:hypothetical protein IE53DRAFT_61023 [Violaceomyces palustris]|uniref:Uncharacterized protein n=1 Tax=Violaceomyces palustris TaxID=1673888 RepID=A0ACD0NZC7_9BASI|nr:hypothetical protein IE53DRAFT_61023 [Violaceomyces palustris]